MSATASDEYLETLLRYYEEEIMGEAYFRGLANHIGEREKLEVLARVERHAANAVRPLLEKYDLAPGDEAELKLQGEEWVHRHQSFDWQELLAYMVRRYPGYLVDFRRLKGMAPEEDLDALGKLTDHEVAAIEFAERELSGEAGSLAPLQRYLAQ